MMRPKLSQVDMKQSISGCIICTVSALNRKTYDSFFTYYDSPQTAMGARPTVSPVSDGCSILTVTEGISEYGLACHAEECWRTPSPASHSASLGWLWTSLHCPVFGHHPIVQVPDNREHVRSQTSPLSSTSDLW